MQKIIFVGLALAMIATVSAIRQDEEFQASWDENRKIQYLEAHAGERERLLNEDQALRNRYFQLHSNEAAGYYGRHPEYNNEWHGGDAWNAGWDENRKIQYLEAHPGERERLLNEDRALRDRYFQLHNDEAGEYYGHHPEFRNEWHGGPVGGDVWNAGWDENRKVQYLETHPGERERLLNEDRALRERYFQAHVDEESGYYGRHPEFHGEFNGRGRKREVGRWNRI